MKAENVEMMYFRWLSNNIDLVPSDEIYHGQCESFFFFTKKYIPTTKGTETEHMAGHPTYNAMKSNFEKLCNWLDGQVDEQTELFTMSVLHAKMCLFAENI